MAAAAADQPQPGNSLVTVCGMFKNPSVQILEATFQDRLSAFPKQLQVQDRFWIGWEKHQKALLKKNINSTLSKLQQF